MTKYLLNVMQYMLTGEESRHGFQDCWKNYFLARHTNAGRTCLKVTKVVFLMALYFAVMKGIGGTLI